MPETAGEISLDEDHSAVLLSWTGAHGFRLGAGPGSGEALVVSSAGALV